MVGPEKHGNRLRAEIKQLATEFCRSPVIWATNQPGDGHLGDNFRTTGRHQLGHPGDR